MHPEPTQRAEPEQHAEPPQRVEGTSQGDPAAGAGLGARPRGARRGPARRRARPRRPGRGAGARLDVETGTERWRAPTGATARAAVISDLGGGRLLVQLPSRFVTVDRQAGRVVGTRDFALGWRFVSRNAGACALNGECDFTPIACDDARPLGGPL
ncbi:MAG: hypothetical protein M5U28_35825 [Sandaracinaceae bacterium]|nr:hypothetical protein [Sandaracinaceae bacterium]